ncbi:hypothetical protein BDQ17DRAFT_1235900 [Cyathus striatus]|nr:hypothetical protein BDQ17DRAFT_1235900 [Cyathus striatus]
MSLTIKNLKVRAKKRPVNVACAPQLSKMLGCWAATGDLQSMSQCQQPARDLFECMRSAPSGKGIHKPTINYHLARLAKKMQ